MIFLVLFTHHILICIAQSLIIGPQHTITGFAECEFCIHDQKTLGTSLGDTSTLLEDGGCLGGERVQSHNMKHGAPTDKGKVGGAYKRTSLVGKLKY